MASILNKDINLSFPDFTIVSASAGSGKTHTLVLRLLQFLLSNRLPHNKLINILAITFTNNAASEMRQRLLEYLKKAYFGDEKVISQLLEILSIEKENLSTRCDELINTILQDYSSFQVQTIDSFMTRLFRASALEFGFSPTVEILTDTNQIFDNALEEFSKEIRIDKSKQELLEQLTDVLVESQKTNSRYIWDPYHTLTDKVSDLYRTLSAQAKDVAPSQSKKHRETNSKISLSNLRKEILEATRQLIRLVEKSGLEKTRHFESVIEAVNAENVDELIGRKSIQKPVKAGNTKSEKQKYNQLNEKLAPLQNKISSLITEYTFQQAVTYYQPIIEAYNLLKSTIEHAMHRNAQVSLTDISRILRGYISKEILPQIYLHFGDAIRHYLIDEFQDTSPAQWETMKPLFEEALSKEGSLFIVGDTKQSIYTFRQADWKIMKMLMENVVFPSAPPKVLELETNYRSTEKIVNFGKEVFQKIVPNEFDNEAPHASGLSKFKQDVTEFNKGKGYVEVTYFEKDTEQQPEREKILEIVKNCTERGYHYSDITILTPKNEDVITVSKWLNDAHIMFISHSSLDVRKQSITSDVLSLLRFLDSPIDNLAFATFILSNTFDLILKSDNIILAENELHDFILETNLRENIYLTNNHSPLYISFRNKYTELWNKYFEDLFNVVGYLPLYDLFSEIYKQFRLFEILPDKQSALVKLLEIIKDFEEKGLNTLKDFLLFAYNDEEASAWNITIPLIENAISVMTIHKAKGLDNRVVIVLLFDSQIKSNNLFIYEDNNGIQLLRITKSNMVHNNFLERLYNQQKLENDVDNLNKLYVAFTRAKEEMYIINVKNERAKEPSKYLPQTGYEPSKKPSVKATEKYIEPAAEIYHPVQKLPTEIVPADKIKLYERRRGELIHQILSKIEFANLEIDSILDSAIKDVKEDLLFSMDIEGIKKLLVEFINLEAIKPFFTHKSGRIVYNEKEFVAPNGQLYRMDRIIVDEDFVTVIDFKTGDDSNEYTQQITHYMDILKQFYVNHKIKGILAFIDKKVIRTINE